MRHKKFKAANVEELRDYLNSLSLSEQEKFASMCNTSVGYLRKRISMRRAPGADLCVLIERSSNGAVTRKNLRKNDWMTTWPELIAA